MRYLLIILVAVAIWFFGIEQPRLDQARATQASQIQPIADTSDCYQRAFAAVSPEWAALSALERAQIALQIIDRCEQQQTAPAAAPVASQGVTLVDPVGQWCAPLPGETVVGTPDAKGACVVVDGAGNRTFINAVGERWPLEAKQ